MISLRDLREQVLAIKDQGGGNIRVHPNSFIQLDLEPVPEGWHATHQVGHSGASRRLHIWNPPGFPLPHQDTYNEIHDHVFDMWSEVVRGSLWQVLYEFEPVSLLPTYERYRAVYHGNSDSRLESTDEIGVLVETDRFIIVQGESYRQEAFTLHDSVPDNGTCVVTVMTKEAVHSGEASVICKLDVPPDNSYDRATAADPEYLWRAVIGSLSL